MSDAFQWSLSSADGVVWRAMWRTHGRTFILGAPLPAALPCSARRARPRPAPPATAGAGVPAAAVLPVGKAATLPHPRNKTPSPGDCFSSLRIQAGARPPHRLTPACCGFSSPACPRLRRHQSCTLCRAPSTALHHPLCSRRVEAGARLRHVPGALPAGAAAQAPAGPRLRCTGQAHIVILKLGLKWERKIGGGPAARERSPVLCVSGRHV